MSRVLAALTVACASVPLAIVGAQPAGAVTPAVVSTTYYMSSVNGTTLKNLGCAKGTADLNMAGTQHNVVVFAYGKLYHDSTKGWMQTAWGAADVTLAQIVAALKQYAYGYWQCTGADVESDMVIAMGTSNYGSGGVTTAAGQAYGSAVQGLANWVDSTLEQVYVFGGNDIELSWSSPAAVRAWISGFDSTSSVGYYDYGAAEGCSRTAYGNCNNGWTANDVWWKSWGASPAWPLPEIYREDGTNAMQWKWIGVYSKSVQNRSMLFQGSLTQHGACAQTNGCSSGTANGTDNLPAEGYDQLYDQLNSDSRSAQSTLRFATDIKWY